MKIEDVKKGQGLLGKQLCRQRERGKRRTTQTKNATTARKRDIWQLIVGQREVEWRKKGQKE